MLRNFGSKVAVFGKSGESAAAVVALLLPDARGGVAEDTVVPIVKPPPRKRARGTGPGSAGPDRWRCRSGAGCAASVRLLELGRNGGGICMRVQQRRGRDCTSAREYTAQHSRQRPTGKRGQGEAGSAMVPAARLRNAAARLHVLQNARSLTNEGRHTKAEQTGRGRERTLGQGLVQAQGAGKAAHLTAPSSSPSPCPSPYCTSRSTSQ